MTFQLAAVLVLLVSAVVMFALNRPRMDVVGLIMMTALPLTGVITVNEALAGFADPNVVLIAALFVVGEGLVRTGIARRLGDWLVRRAGRSEARLIVLLMVVVAGVGSVMSSTGIVAIFIPVVLRIARTAAIPAGRLMMPLSVAALISGMMTLVGTAPNLVVHGELARRGLEGFQFFSFTPFGLTVLVLAIGYMLAVRGWLGGDTSLPGADGRPSLARWIEAYALAGREHRLRVAAGSPLAGRSLADLDLRGSAGVNILAIERPGRIAADFIRPRAETRLNAGDILFLDLARPVTDIHALAERFGLEWLPLSDGYFADRAEEIGLAEVMIPPDSALVGGTAIGTRFRTTHHVAVIGIRRQGEPVRGSVADQPLQAGDTLLVVGSWRAIFRLQADRRSLVLLDLPAEAENVAPAASRAPLAILSLAVMIALMVTGLVPNVLAALIACLLLGLFGCIDMHAAYRSMHWQSLVLIVGMLPFSLALQKTGGVDAAAALLLAALGDAGPRAALAGIFVVTAGLSLFVSNTATAVLMAPVALSVAASLGASPYPFAMTVALAASAAFVTPVSSPVNMLVVGPGGYAFSDFVRIGLPFTLVTLVAVVALVPVLLPP